jgi:hypothetical protein
MSRSIEVRLVDDLDGGVADESVQFGLDGATYEVDLSAKHAKELRAALDKFVQVARRSSGKSTAQRARGSRPRASRADHEQNQAIREWAQRKGLEIATRGRISRAIVEEFQAEAERKATPTKRRR